MKISKLLVCTFLSIALPFYGYMQTILPGAHQTNLYLSQLQKTKVAIFANQTSTIGKTHLVDSLLKLKVPIVKIFAPEHGFRGTADAGEKVDNSIDSKTKLPIISLYGKHNKPTSEDLKDVKLLVFDVQDVGVRYYTYISSLQLILEAALENNIPLMILDRPNPNGHYVDGPVLDTSLKSFVGMQPIPTVYGMTIGEYANMLLYENMLSTAALKAWQTIQVARYAPGSVYFSLQIIPCKNYTHKSKYQLPIAPSPNLPNMQSIYLYPSTCYFEGTPISLGRGTTTPFQVYGHPSLSKKLYSFTPKSTAGAKEPPQKDKKCFGYNLTKVKITDEINLDYLLNAYKLFPQKDSFFVTTSKAPIAKDYFFNKLMGDAITMQLIKSGAKAIDIKKNWQDGIARFKKIRKKYLLYTDFE
jgi:uncharacterized protein YbbC (DUF1343 family)